MFWKDGRPGTRQRKRRVGLVLYDVNMAAKVLLTINYAAWHSIFNDFNLNKVSREELRGYMPSINA